MAAISQKIPNLVGGVSQQPDSIKLNNQLRECTNYYPDPTFGLAKRPGLRGIRRLANAANAGTWFSIFKDDEEKYMAQFTNAGVLRIWDADSGIEQTVNTPAASATTYATHTDSSDLAILQINDYTFVLNRQVTVVEDTADLTAAITPYGFVTIGVVAYATIYKITIDATTFTYSTPTAGGTQVNVDDIVTNLVSSINTNPLYVATGIGNAIHIRRANNADFSLEAKGGQNSAAIKAYKGTVTTVSELPQQFLNNAKVKILASEGSQGDDYWVQFKTSNNGAQGTGIWEETIGGGIVRTIDEATLPHAIIREANGTFTFRRLDEASATATPTTATVTGVPQTVSITTSNNGRYAVGQSFPVSGGSGINLRLKVTGTTTNVTTTDVPWIASPVTYVERIVYTNSTQVYNWYFNGTIVRTASTDATFNIANNEYQVLGSYHTVASGAANVALRQQAGVRIITTVTGVVSSVSISRAGRNYTAADVVTNEFGDTFTINTVASVTSNVDSIGKLFWKPRSVGDAETNPMPSFVGSQIQGISFFKNRLILLSGENVITSQAGDYFNFFASTVITIVDSDPIDISCGALRPVKLTHAVSVPRGLVLFADNAQYIFETTTEAFSASTAEINLLSSYSISTRATPVDIGPSIVFIEQNDTATSIFEMAVADSANRPAVAEISRNVPTYLPSDVRDLKVTTSAATFAISSNQDPTALYLFRFYNNGNERIMSSWFKWTLPGDVVAYEFQHDTLYIITSQDNGHILSKVNLLTDTPGGALFFEDSYVDLRLDIFDYNPTRVYFSGTNTTHICFKEGFEDTDLQPVVVSLSLLQPGVVQELPLQTDLTQPVGQRYFVELEGDHTTLRYALGYKYEASAVMPAFYVIGSEGRKDTLNVPMLNRLSIDSYNSGPFKVKVRANGRSEYVAELPQINTNQYLANSNPIQRNPQGKIPVMAKGNQVEVELVADSPFPTAFTSLTWEGTFNNRGIKAV